MKKSRHLRKSIETVLVIITILLFMFLVMIDDFELSAFPIIVLGWGIVLFNGYILNKYGTGVWFEQE